MTEAFAVLIAGLVAVVLNLILPHEPEAADEHAEEDIEGEGHVVDAVHHSDMKVDKGRE